MTGITLFACPKLRFLLLSFIICHYFCLSQALLNITIDDTSPLIRFEPEKSWTRIIDSDSNLDAGGSHMVTEDLEAFASLTISFSSAYFLAPSWPYPVSSQISVGDSTFIVDLQDHSVPDLGFQSNAPPTIQSRPVARIVNGNFSSRTIKINVPPGGRFAVFDMIIIQIPDDQPIPTGLGTIGAISGSTATTVSVLSGSPTATTLSNATSTPSHGPTPPDADSDTVPPGRQNSGLFIAIGVLVPAIAILIGLTIWKWVALRRSRRSKKRHISDIDPGRSMPAREYPHYSASIMETPYGGIVSAPATPRSGPSTQYNHPRTSSGAGPHTPRQISVASSDLPSPVAYPHPPARMQAPVPVMQEKSAELQVLNPPRFTMLSGVMTLSSPPSYLSTLGGTAGPSTSFSDVPPVPPLPTFPEKSSRS